MSAYLVVSTHIAESDRGTYDQYILRVKPIIEKYGGEYLVRTERIIALSDQWRPDRFILIKFPDKETLTQCLASAEYQAIADMRLTSVDARALIVDGQID